MKEANDQNDALLATKYGMALRFSIEDLRTIKSRTSNGVRGIKLKNGDEVISLSIIHHIREPIDIREEYLKIPAKHRIEMQNIIESNDDAEADKLIKQYSSNKSFRCLMDIDQIIRMCRNEEFILTVKSNGLAKRTSSYEYRITNKGGQGVKNILLGQGVEVISSFIVKNSDEIVITSSAGKLVRCNVCDISLTSRATKGVRIINIEEGEKVVSVTRIQGSLLEGKESIDEKETDKNLTLDNI
ncbi:hypothetical protein N9A04_00715 [Rickettsiales bacterium]|nr:hypothetical protein [Rickettsiales bacterium]